MSDYLNQIDLNLTINGGPAVVNQPLDPRAMHYFGFTANGQELTNLSTFRMFASWSYANQPVFGTGGPFPPVDVVLDPGQSVKYDENHDRAHVLVWLDPMAAPPLGTAVNVRVRAWAK